MSLEFQSSIDQERWQNMKKNDLDEVEIATFGEPASWCPHHLQGNLNV
jgi:hypothetical protein